MDDTTSSLAMFGQELTRALRNVLILTAGALLVYLPTMLFGAGYSAICALMGA